MEKWKKYALAAAMCFVFLSFVETLGGSAGIIMSGIAGWQIGEWSLALSEKLLSKA